MIKQDEELDKLEEDIRKLKNRYDQFFMGIQKMPPTNPRHNLEIYIFELGKQKMREREEGPLDFRRRRAALETPEPPAAPAHPSRPRVTSAASDPYVLRVAPGSNGDELRTLYGEIEKEHLKLGKRPSITYEQLTAMVKKQSDMLRERYHVNAVAFRVDVVDGKVKLKAKPIQE